MVPKMVTTDSARTKKSPQSRASLANMVGTMRFELMTPSTPRKCATKLRYVPTTAEEIIIR